MASQQGIPQPKTRRQRPGNPNLRNATELTTGAGQTPFHPCEAGARAEETGRSRDHGETARVRAEETDRLLDLGKTARHPARGETVRVPYTSKRPLKEASLHSSPGPRSHLKTRR
ncbi:hypothetical protein MTO96_016358 [Rhipicephalus appendiculatus]